MHVTFFTSWGGQGRQEGSDYIYIFICMYIYMKLLLNRKHDFFRTPQRAIQLLGDPTRMNDRTGHEFAQVQETKKNGDAPLNDSYDPSMG